MPRREARAANPKFASRWSSAASELRLQKPHELIDEFQRGLDLKLLNANAINDRKFKSTTPGAMPEKLG
ncbi:hypothetical protein [Mesorhizobium sp.]|uniref:hypothetical protein n=1 Tax=Mesorhizobium sp. TaxID=1871066 RepID=UPI000FE640BB|nr:hypothetical protein [Mesorhizobium sp.]RWK54102.1 MAG: hypothetical protein EOR48_18905 [Mesorhizobium sp.]TIP45330.1 MAG: hypothetical protein E5X62_12770 [Mesorhizobium sp.]